MKKLSIIIPCYNEVENLPKLIQEIGSAVSRTDVEVILVNNGSTDNSAHVLERLTRGTPFLKVVTIAKNQGYGHGIVQGLMSAEGTYLGWMHGDLQTPFKNTLQALTEIESLNEPEDIYIKGLRKGRPLFDQFFTFGMSIFETLLLRKKLYDINAQPNIFHRRFFETWQNPPRDFSLDLYAFYLAHREHLNIVRIPVVFLPRTYGLSHWNTGIISKMAFIQRTVAYSMALKKNVRPHRTMPHILHMPLFRYLVAGGVAGVIHLFLLYALTDILNIYYLISTSVALFIVFWVSFFLQKYWAFGETSAHRFGGQAARYLILHSFAFISNGSLMYLLVSILGVWYMFAQVLVSLSIALVTFVINKKYIFNQAN